MPFYRPFAFMGFMIVASFIVWVVIVTPRQERLERMCAPVRWLGNMLASIAFLGSETAGNSVQRAFDSAFEGCQYTMWRLFYEGKDEDLDYYYENQ